MITLGGITLPDDLQWVDEYKWSPVSQNIDISLTGALIIQEAAQAKGRPITLQGDDSSAWITKATLEQLRTLAASAVTSHQLSYNGTLYTVMFTRSALPIEAEQIVPFANPQNDDFYKIIIRLFEV